MRYERIGQLIHENKKRVSIGSIVYIAVSWVHLYNGICMKNAMCERHFMQYKYIAS